jgi:sodium/bile acid cotransporter 7
MLRRLPIDPYILAMVATVAFASLCPVRGESAIIVGWGVKLAIALLFFLHGARLPTQEALAGLKHWRLQTAVLSCTFVLFPLIGIGAATLTPDLLSPPLMTGLLYLCILPSTVQSSIAFTSIARGNVAGALCAASASNLFGIFLTPLLAALLMKGQSAGFSLDALGDIILQLLFPFLAGQLARPLLGAFVTRHRAVLNLVDRGSILLIIYAAFSEGVVKGVWSQLGAGELLRLSLVLSGLLAFVLTLTTFLSRRLGFAREDEIVIVFCGSKKGLSAGLAMASVLFTGPQIGLFMLPIMLFHQIQLMVCAVIAQRYAAQWERMKPQPPPFIPQAGASPSQ